MRVALDPGRQPKPAKFSLHRDRPSKLTKRLQFAREGCAELRKYAKLSEGDSQIPSSIIVSNPAILSGEPVFRGTRVPFKSLTDYLEHGRALSEFLEDFPSVTGAEAIAAIEEARTSLTATLK